MFRISGQVLRSYGLCTSWIVHSWASYVHKQVLQARHCWDDCLYPQFPAVTWAGFLQDVWREQHRCLRGNAIHICTGSMSQIMGKIWAKTEGLARKAFLNSETLKNCSAQASRFQLICIAHFCLLLPSTVENCTLLPFPTHSSSGNCWAHKARQLCISAAAGRAKSHQSPRTAQTPRQRSPQLIFPITPLPSPSPIPN